MFAQPELNHKGPSQTHTHPMRWMPWDACTWDARHSLMSCHVMSLTHVTSLTHVMSCHVTTHSRRVVRDVGQDYLQSCKRRGIADAVGSAVT